MIGDRSGPAMATIHPRAVVLHREPPSGMYHNVFPAHIAGVDREGDRWRVQLDGPIPLVVEVSPGGAADLHLAEGGDVFAAFNAAEVDVYPA